MRKNFGAALLLSAFNLATTLIVCLIASPAEADQTWIGRIKIWTADLCDGATCGSAPEPNGVEWTVELPVREETAPGYHVIARHVFENPPWSVQLLVTRMNPIDGTPAYISTQTSLKESSFGTVAQCARYDAVGAFSFLPPGSCSGQLHGKLTGVSLYSPYAASLASEPKNSARKVP